MPDNVCSFRDFLKQSLKDTEVFRGVERKVDLLLEIVLLLTNYQEEGISLFPVIFVSDSLERIMKDLHGLEAIHIGEGPNQRETFIRAFKACAPLGEDRLWAVAIIVKGDRISYGIFRSDASPLAPSVFERLRGMMVPEGGIVGLTRLGNNFVEIRSSNGKFQYINVSGLAGDEHHPVQVIRAFVETVSSDSKPELKNLVQSFYYRLGMDILHGTHGTLIAIQKTGLAIPEFLEDGIHLRPSLKIAEAIESIAATPHNRESYLRLLSYGQLLRKLTWLDGITLLDTEGSLLAYRCFIRGAAPDPLTLHFGGARSRAYDVMQRYVPSRLSGAFSKSQDGQMNFRASK